MEMDWQRMICHLVRVTLHYLISLCGGCMKYVFHTSPLPITSTEPYERMLAAVVIFTPGYWRCLY
jgi:hypothetical protein